MKVVATFVLEKAIERLVEREELVTFLIIPPITNSML